MDARFKLLEIASFLDRVDRHEGDADFRHPAFAKALAAMQNPPEGTTRAQAVHLAGCEPGGASGPAGHGARAGTALRLRPQRPVNPALTSRHVSIRM